MDDSLIHTIAQAAAPQSADCKGATCKISRRNGFTLSVCIRIAP